MVSFSLDVINKNNSDKSIVIKRFLWGISYKTVPIDISYKIIPIDISMHKTKGISGYLCTNKQTGEKEGVQPLVPTEHT